MDLELINNAYIHDYLYTLFVYDPKSEENGIVEAEYYRFKNPVDMMNFMHGIVHFTSTENVAFVFIKPRNELQ